MVDEGRNRFSQCISKGIDLHFKQSKTFPNQITSVIFLNHLMGVCSSREPDTGFALKDMILCDKIGNYSLSPL